MTYEIGGNLKESTVYVKLKPVFSHFFENLLAIQLLQYVELLYPNAFYARWQSVDSTDFIDPRLLPSAADSRNSWLGQDMVSNIIEIRLFLRSHDEEKALLLAFFPRKAKCSSFTPQYVEQTVYCLMFNALFDTFPYT